MNKIVRKIQQATEKADEIRRVVEGVPPKIAEVKQAIFTTAGQVQKLRGDVMNTVGTLRVENDGQVLDALRELDEHADTLRDAGCSIERVDMDLGPTRRLVVHLARMDQVDADRVRELVEEHKDLPTVRALLAAILKADELAGKLELTELSYTRLTVELGLISTVRMGWRTADEGVAVRATAEAASAAAMAVGPQAATTERGPTFAQSSYFEPKAAVQAAAAEALAPTVAAEIDPVAALVQAGVKPVHDPRLVGDWRKTALDRFKKMPDLTR